MTSNVLKLTLILCLITSLAEGQNYYQKGSGQKIANEPMYILPKAALAIEIQVVKLTYTRGKLFKTYDQGELDVFEARYGVDQKIYDKLKSINEFNSVSFSNDSLKVAIVAVPDYDKVFYIDPNVKWNKNLTVTFTYGDNGILIDGESNLEDRTLDLIAKGLSGVASVAGSVFLLDAPPASSAKIDDLEAELNNFAKLDNQLNYDIYKDLKSSTEKNYAKVFSKYFYTVKKTVTKTKIFFTPKGADLGTDIPLFTVSEEGEVVISTKYKDQVWGKKLKFLTVESPEAYTLNLSKHGEQRMDHHRPRVASDLGFAYNIPAVAELKITSPKSEVIHQELCKIPQFGIVGFVGQKKGKLTYSLDPITGELKKIVIDSKAITTDQIGAASTGVTEAANAIKGDSYDTTLQKEVTRLENEKKKRDLLRDLGIE